MAVDYATNVYKITVEMPWFEKKGLCDQLQRAVVSISSNIAEGCAKPSDAGPRPNRMQCQNIF